MKPFLHNNARLALYAPVIGMLLSMLSFSSSFGNNVTPLQSLLQIPGDSIFIQKKVTSRLHKISLYPDANGTVVFFNVRGEEGKAYQLFVFDLEGRLVKQSEIKNKQTSVIKDISKGIYLFDVFSDDDKIGNGQMTVK